MGFKLISTRHGDRKKKEKKKKKNTVQDFTTLTK
jgi:hypothetical protein